MRLARVNDPDARLLRRASGGDVAALSVLYDRHSAALFNLAYGVSGDLAAAGSAVHQAFGRVCADPSSTRSGTPLRRNLARLTFLASREAADHIQDEIPKESVKGRCSSVRGQERALLGLTMYGGHSYREAAELLLIDAGDAAEILRASLRRSAEVLRASPLPADAPSEGMDARTWSARGSAAGGA